MVIYGTIAGDRTTELQDCYTITNLTHPLKCEMVFNPEKPSRLKSIFKSNPTPADFFDGIITDDLSMDWLVARKQKVPKTADRIYGYWTHQVFFKGAEIWNIDSVKPNRLRPVTNPLPSDGKFREDLLYLQLGDKAEAQRHKDILENKQRSDRKLRANASSVKK